MPRPCKKRRICAMPHTRHFGPKDSQKPYSATVIMSMDEYECIRLIDLEAMTQEQCAAQMQVARTTVQAIYTSARKKLARCLVNEEELRIEGGDVFLCEGRSQTPCAKICAKRSCRAQ